MPAPDAVGKPAPNAAKKDASPRVRTSFEKMIQRGPLVGIDLEILGFNVDGDEFLGLLVDLDLGADDSFEDFTSTLGEFRWFFGHGIVEDHGQGLDLPVRPRYLLFPHGLE